MLPTISANSYSATINNEICDQINNSEHPEINIWDKIKDSFPEKNHDKALGYIINFCETPEQLYPEDIKNKFEELQKLAFPGLIDNIKCDENNFHLNSKNGQKILSITIDNDMYTLDYCGHRDSYTYNPNTSSLAINHANTQSTATSNIEKCESSSRSDISLTNMHNLIDARDEIFNKINELNKRPYHHPLREKEKEEYKLLCEKYGHYHTKIKEYELLRDTSHGIGIQFKKEHYPPLRGEHCKISSLALLDAHFSDLMEVNNIPLLSEQKWPHSVRKIAKSVNSKQGEVLQTKDLKTIAEKMGYKADIIHIDNISDYRKIIEQNIRNKGVITFYSSMGDNPYNIKSTLNSITDERFEHATVISKYDRERDVCTLNHWGEKFPGVPVSLLFDSNSKLSETRRKEYYYIKNNRHLNAPPTVDDWGKREYKYKIIPEITSLGHKIYHNSEYMETPSPAQGSGFKGVIMIIEPDLANARWMPHKPES